MLMYPWENQLVQRATDKHPDLFRNRFHTTNSYRVLRQAVIAACHLSPDYRFGTPTEAEAMQALWALKLKQKQHALTQEAA